MKIPRMSDWFVYAVLLVGLIWWIAPQQLSVVAYKVTLLALAAVLAYMIDRSLFKRTGDSIDHHMLRDNVSAARLLARALVFLGTVLGVTLGI